MEDTLRGNHASGARQLMLQVLILVLMEDTLREPQWRKVKIPGSS